MDRRKFFQLITKGLVAFWGIFAIYPIARYLQKPADESKELAEVVVCKVNEITPGQSKTFKWGNHPGLLIADQKGNYHAFDATCTHLGCTAQYRSEKNDIFCACHEGVYDLEGKNVAGPPPRPLLALKVAVKDEQIVVSKA